jgi:hypothetical protein
VRIKYFLFKIFCVITIFLLYGEGFAQNITDSAHKSDTFFLAKEKGVVGKLGQIVSVGDQATSQMDIIKTVNPFLPESGKTINNIQIISLGFDRDINDTATRNADFGIRVANLFHKNTKEKVLFNDLFFKKGDKVYPYVLADNERYLRDLPYLQEARIILKHVPNDPTAVDVIVLTKDVFSIGVNLDARTNNNFKLELRDENLAGNAEKIALSTLYDKSRNPGSGFGIEFVQRNIKHSFIDWTLGAINFANTFNNGKRQLLSFYSHFEKPLISPYIPWIGSLDIALNTTANNYNDSFYISDLRYRTINIDWWYGYSFGSKSLKYKNKQTRLRKFVSLREFNQYFVCSQIKVNYFLDSIS